MAEGDRRTWYLRRVDLFEGLSDAEIENLAALLEIQSFRPGDLIVDPDTPAERVYIIKDGTVRLFHRGPDGREITADWLGPGRVFGVSALFGSARNGLLAQAQTDVVMCIARGRELLPVISRWPRVMLNLAVQLAAQVLQTEEQLDVLASADTRTRLAGALYRLACDAGEDRPGGARRIRGTPTHAALARQIGASRETVTRVLATLESEGYIRREGRQIVVVDPARLRDAFELSDDV